MVAWPSTLPTEQFIGLTDKRADARLRTSMDTGLSKMRQRFTTTWREIRAPIVLTGAQRVIFDDFYINELQEGSLRFDWDDPTTDASPVTFRFAGQGGPEWKLEVGGDPDDRVWVGILTLEIVP